MGLVHEIGFLVFEGIKMLDVAGPSEVFAEANLFGGAYRISILTADGRDVRATTGLRVPADGSAFQDRHWDTVLVPGGNPFPATPVPDDLTEAVRHLASRTDRIGSICTGAFVLGAAGLLDGKHVTTHWKHAAELARRHPSARVEPDRIFVHDHSTFTSAGVSAGIDLALSLLEKDHGPDLTRSVARSLVVYMQRAGGQSQFSSMLDAPKVQLSVVQEVVDQIRSDPGADYSLDRLARIGKISPRHLSRLFQDEFGTTPVRYTELIRMELAKSRLDSGYSVTMAAELSGFGSSESLRRAFAKHLRTSPQRYQRRFRTTNPAGAAALA